MRIDERTSALVLPLALRLAGKPINPKLAELLGNERLTASALAELQWAKLTALLAHCYECVPYYRRMFDEVGAHPSDIRTLAHYAKLPTTGKATLREVPDSLLSDRCRMNELKVIRTGGSTGVPVTVYQDEEYYCYGWDAFQRNMLWTGFTPGERQAWFTRPENSVASRRLRLALERKWVVGIGARSDKAFAEWAKGMLKHEPRFVHGHAVAIASLATYALKHDIRFESVHQVMTTSETLTPQMREDIAEAFCAQVYSQYGCSEIYAIASECSHGNMHVNSDMNLVEFVPITKPGGIEAHEIVVTPLHAFAQPLVRFRPGDSADPIEGRCSCGLPFPIMGMVEGRVDDTLTFSGGTEVSSAMLERIVRAIPGVARFQFRQTSRDALQLLVVADRRFTDQSLEKLRGTQEQFALQAGIRIDIAPVLVDEIEVLPNGKHQAVIRLEELARCLT